MKKRRISFTVVLISPNQTKRKTPFEININVSKFILLFKEFQQNRERFLEVGKKIYKIPFYEEREAFYDLSENRVRVQNQLLDSRRNQLKH